MSVSNAVEHKWIWVEGLITRGVHQNPPLTTSAICNFLPGFKEGFTQLIYTLSCLPAICGYYHGALGIQP